MERSTYQSMAALQADHWWFRARRTILADVLGRLPLLPAAPRILEAGCGPGGNLQMLSEFGSLYAFDCDVESVAQARAFGCATVDRGALPNSVPFEGPFDLVTALDVIEHVDDDFGSLQTLTNRLAVGGYLLITVPAFQSLWSAFDVAHHHKRRYTRSAIQALVRKTGCVVVKSTYFNSHLFPLIAAVRIAQRQLGLGTRAEDARVGKTLNRLLERIFASERFLLRHTNYPVGLSVLIIAQREANAPTSH